jgi:hypothetical protein
MNDEITMRNGDDQAAARTGTTKTSLPAEQPSGNSSGDPRPGEARKNQQWRKNLNLAPKVGISLVAGAVSTIIVAECTRRGVTIPADEGAAITTLLMFLAGYLTPHAQN